MARLTGLDGAFLAFESSTTHLHVMGTMVFDPSDIDGVLTFRRIRSLIDERVPLVAPFRMRIMDAPFGLQQPTLIEDPDFDLDYHVRRTSIPAPGGHDELAELVADLAARPLDRTRPLWEFHVVEGLAEGRVGIVAKVHHAIIDGVSGAQLLATFFDLSPLPTPRRLFGGVPLGTRPPVSRSNGSVEAVEDKDQASILRSGWSPAELPSELHQLWHSVSGLPDQIDAVGRSIARTVQTIRAAGSPHGEAGPNLTPSPFVAPKTSVNGSISSHRRVAFADLSLADLRNVARAFGSTTNDVVLAVTAGGLQKLFAERGEEPETSLVALVPVSVRTPGEQVALGNRVSGLLVSLATGVADPVARLGHIRDGMLVAKEQHGASGSELFASWAEVVFPAVATRISRLVTNLRLFDHMAPPFNLIVSNVPGPGFPLYLAGARMQSIYPLGPIVEGIGLNVTVFSYLDTVHLGVLACWDLVPDVAVLALGMKEALAELVAEADHVNRPVPWWHAEIPA
jgi:diacylglycerol O-acyltransferase